MRFTYTGYKILGFCMVGFGILGGAFISYDILVGIFFILLSLICLIVRRKYNPWS